MNWDSLSVLSVFHLDLPRPTTSLNGNTENRDTAGGRESSRGFLSASQKGWPVPLPGSSGTGGKDKPDSLMAHSCLRCPKTRQGCADSQWARKGILGKNPTKAPIAQWLRQGSGARIPGFSFPLGDPLVCDLRQATQAFWASVVSCVTGTIVVPISLGH